MHAYLIIGSIRGDVESRINKYIKEWSVSSWDTIRVPAEGVVGINLIRDFERALQFAPRNSPVKVGVLTDMDRLTPEAQNAVLKTLEEPPPHTYIIGTTAVPEALLPTIRSRMSVIRLSDAPEAANSSITQLLQRLLRESPGKRLQLVEPYTTTREDAKLFVNQLLVTVHSELVKRPSQQFVRLTKKLLHAQTLLAVNVNLKLVVDDLFLGK